MSVNFSKKDPYLDQYSLLGIAVAISILLILFSKELKDYFIKSDAAECIDCTNEMDPEDEKHCILFSTYWGYEVCDSEE